MSRSIDMEKPTVMVIYRGGLADTAGKTEETVCAETIGGVLKYIRREYGKQAYAAARSMVIAVNGISILKLRVFKTTLADGDRVQFLPISGGG